eukprot:2451919-Prymnesium_polylepis.2
MRRAPRTHLNEHLSDALEQLVRRACGSPLVVCADPSSKSPRTAGRSLSSARGESDGAHFELVSTARGGVEDLQLDTARRRAARDPEIVLQEDADVAVRVGPMGVD